MADQHFRVAQRHWQASGTYESWVAYLYQARRAGAPVFTKELLRDLLRVYCSSLGSETASRMEAAYTATYEEIAPPMQLDYMDTDDGFICKVEHAFNPPIERVYHVRTSHGYEPESAQLWDRWSGTIKVCWATDFEPPCPGLEIRVKAWQQPGGYYITRDEPDEEEYVYEGDCVTSPEQLAAALCDDRDWLAID